jgi:uncharacterized protein
VKIRIALLCDEGVTVEEDISPAALDLETEIVRFQGPVHIRATASRITNAVSADVSLSATMYFTCGRCLDEFKVGLAKQLKWNYPVDKDDKEIDLGPDIREEIILDYPIQPLCRPGCKGICSTCGKNLNEGGCSCATTEKKTL